MRLSILVSLIAAQLALGAVVKRQDAGQEEDAGETGTMTALDETVPATTSVPAFGGEVSTSRKGQFGGAESSMTPTASLGPSSTTSTAPTVIATEGSHEIHSCHQQFYENVNGDTPYQPFCEPRNGSIWTPETPGFYHITWDTARFAENETVTLSLNRDNKDHPYIVKDEPKGVWLETVRASKGFFAFKPKDLKPFLHYNGTDHEETTLYFMISSDSKSNEGPTINVSIKEEEVPPKEPEKVDKKAIAIGIPLAFVGVAAILLMLHCTMRRERRIGPIAIGGVRGRRKDYASRKSQAERLRGVAPTHQRLPDNESDWELSNVKGAGAHSDPFRDLPSPNEQPARFRDSAGSEGMRRF